MRCGGAPLFATGRYTIMRPTDSNFLWLHQQLVDAYGMPPAKAGRDPLETLMNTILSQNTSDVNRDKAYRGLKSRFSSWDAVKSAPLVELAEAIRPGGLANQKSRRMQNILRWLEREFGSLNLDWICERDPDEMIKLFTAVKGIGVKTIAIVLCFACGQDVFPVDTHVHRVSKRLGLVPEKATPEKTFRLLHPLVPAGLSQSLHLNMIRHGRQTCKARKPLCEECGLLEKCDYGSRFLEGTG